MNQRSALCLCGLATLAAVLSGCRQGELIDSDTAASLLKDRNTETVKLTFSASPPRSGEDVMVGRAYDRLVDAHVLTCATSEAMGKICQPGPAGDAVTQAGANELSLIAGRWVPATINNIARAGENGATAEVHMVFEASPLYREFQGAFDEIQMGGGRARMEVRKEGKLVHAVYQRLDDGWHLDSVN
jgi:hypothetical protein